MAIYVLPQATAFRDYALVPALVERPLRAHIAGGQAQTVRFNQAGEQAQGFLDYYDPLIDETFLWPGRASPSVLDTAFTKLWAKPALLQYFATQIGGGHNIVKVAGFGNRIESGDLNFAENGTDFP